MAVPIPMLNKILFNNQGLKLKIVNAIRIPMPKSNSVSSYVSPRTSA